MVERAPEPDDIIWENLDNDEYTALAKRLVLYLVLILAIFLDMTLLFYYQSLIFESDY